MKHGKKYVESAKLIDKSKFYEVAEALELATKTASAKFDETVEMHIRLGVDSRHADQQVRGAVVLPNGTGKKVRVAVFAKGDAAKAAEAAGADAISLINTITGMKIDIHKRTFAIANKTGGMSGPAIKPIAVRMVYQTAQAVKIPIIGMGGIANAEDAIEFLLAGASAVSIGAMNFVNPYTTVEVVEGIEAYMKKYSIEDINELIGAVK